MRVLAVEDDSNMAASIQQMLTKDGYICDLTDTGEDGLELAKIYDYDIVLLDLMLPDISGYDLLRKLRSARVQTPVLILSGLNALDNRLRALGIGADDYLTKPFDKRELSARIQAIVRRARGHAKSTIEIGELTLDLDTRTLHAGDQPIHLTLKEYGVMELLALRKGNALSKESFLQHLYNGLDEPEIKIIDVFVCKLRKKIARATGKNYIQTVWGRGYMLSDPQRANVEAA